MTDPGMNPVIGEAASSATGVDEGSQPTNRRPYPPGAHLVDTRGNDYLVDANGAVRRVVLIPGEQGYRVRCITKMGKKRRKAQKRARQAPLHT